MGDDKQTINVQYKHVSTKEKYCFGIGAIGKDAIVNLVGSFLMLYLTDTLYLAPAFVGILFLVARIWDAVNDPFMGMIVDNTRTRHGKFRIWLIVGTLLNSVVFVLLFTSCGLEGSALYAYVSIMYILYGMTYTIMDVPYWSWLPNLTNDPHEREKISVVPRFFASLAGFCVATFGLYIINAFNRMAGNENLLAEQGYTYFAIAIAVIFIITIGITVANVKEESTLKSDTKKTSIRQALNVITKMTSFWPSSDFFLPSIYALRLQRGLQCIILKTYVGMSIFILFSGLQSLLKCSGLLFSQRLHPESAGRKYMHLLADS